MYKTRTVLILIKKILVCSRAKLLYSKVMTFTCVGVRLANFFFNYREYKSLR